MDYVLASFGVFFIYSLLNSYLALPGWAWTLCQILLSAGAWWVVGAEEWWRIPMIAGITTLIKGTEALLLVTRDRATVDLLRSQRR
jgi:hypothetical protein